MSNENKKIRVTCPHCGKEFSLEEAYVGNAVNLINEKEFNNRLNEALKNKSNEWQLKWNQKEKALLKECQEKLDKEKDTSNNLKIKCKELETTNKLLENKYKSDIKIAIKDLQVENAKLKNDNETQIRMFQDKIKSIEEFKSKQSVKDFGESLEQYCFNQFNTWKSNGAFPTAKLEKDNKISHESSSKGDFIFKDYVDDKEYVSIMFEMKNEQDTTKTKHKNSDFFKELDKDRKEKNCEYAILVSCLELNNKMYDQGIVDVSYISGYEKMYVVRPDYFVTVISLITNLAKKNISLQYQLQSYQHKNIDITNFEEKLKAYKESCQKNMSRADNDFTNAINEINKSIKHLEATKEELLKSNNQWHKANNKIQDLSIRSLTYNNPTMKKMFDDARKK